MALKLYSSVIGPDYQRGDCRNVGLSEPKKANRIAVLARADRKGAQRNQEEMLSDRDTSL